MQLFEKRVKTIQIGFTYDQEIRVSVDKLCNLVEGHPLAIELVAGSISGDIKKKIQDTMGQGLSAFISALSNSKQYHQTLSKVFEVSWTRLGPLEQRILATLSVFKGGFDKDTYRNLINREGFGLIQLINQSLVRENRMGRYDLHEMVRQFTDSKLRASGRWEEAHENHANYYLDFLTEQGNCFERGEQSASLDQVELELKNIKSAWDWMLNNNKFDRLLPELEILYQFFNIRSRFLEGLDWFLQTNDKVSNPEDWPLLHAMLLNRIGSLAYRARENDLALESF